MTVCRRTGGPRLLGQEPGPQNFDEIAELRWLARRQVTPEVREQFARRYPNARVTDSFDDLCADPTLDADRDRHARPTHYALAKQALEAGKHVFVEKPPAMRASADGGARLDLAE